MWHPLARPDYWAPPHAPHIARNLARRTRACARSQPASHARSCEQRPGSGADFLSFSGHLLPTNQPLAAPATLHDSPCFRGLLSWIWVRIDEYPLAAPSFSKRDRAPGARSDCTRERRRVAGFRSLWRVVAVRRSGPCDARRTQTLGWNGSSQHGKPTLDPRLNG